MSVETKTKMTCSVYLPSITEAEVPKSVPTLMYLSGLTCSDENVCQKSGIFKTLSELQVSNHIMHPLQNYRSPNMVTSKRLLFVLSLMK
jgi:S-formylglutathione hydrolase FrmB